MTYSLPDSTISNLIGSELAAWAAKHLRIVRNDGESTASLVLTPNGYVLNLGRCWERLDAAARRELILHELAHLFRGDCLVRVASPSAWNVAADAVINELGQFSALEQHVPIVRWPYLAARLNVPADPLPSARWIYARLTDHAPSAHAPTDGAWADGAWTDDVRGMVGPQEACAAAHVAAVLSAPQRHQLCWKHRNPPPPPPPPVPMPAAARALRKILHRIRGMGGTTKQRRRSWLREGRLPMTPGRTMLPTTKVAICVDTSGSMTNVLPVALGGARWLSRRCEARVMVWANTAQWVQRTIPDVGKTTCPNTMFALLAAWRPNVAIVLTDAIWPENTCRPDTLNSTPIIWICTRTKHDCLPQRPCDRILVCE